MSRDRVLVVDDEKLIRWSIRKRLEEEGYAVEEAETARAASERIDEHDDDLILLDFKLPDGTGLDVLEKVRAAQPETAVVMMSAYGTVDRAVEAMKRGAIDFLTKPIDLDRLVVVVGRALETTRLRREVRHLREEQRALHGNIQLIGKSAPMRRVSEMIAKVCGSQASTVLLEGESGTGKDLVAKAIHYGSPRGERPFVNITCSALTETLLESELFGHERGAFTDARTQKKGLLETADGGTAFLDEIGEMGLSMQAKLLRFLEEKTFKRVGGTRDIHVEVRIIAATNRVLEDAVQSGRFRADLFYRLMVIPITLPPLRERREDIPLLVQHFLDHLNRELRKNTTEVDPEAMQRMVDYAWPGNIRELRNAIERILILEDKRRIEVDDLPRGIADGKRSHAALSSRAEPASLPLGEMSLEELERSAIRQALDRSGANQVRAAKLLGISRDTLRYRMRKFGLLAGGGD